MIENASQITCDRRAGNCLWKLTEDNVMFANWCRVFSLARDYRKAVPTRTLISKQNWTKNLYENHQYFYFIGNINVLTDLLTLRPNQHFQYHECLETKLFIVNFKYLSAIYG